MNEVFHTAWHCFVRLLKGWRQKIAAKNNMLSMFCTLKHLLSMSESDCVLSRENHFRIQCERFRLSPFFKRVESLLAGELVANNKYAFIGIKTGTYHHTKRDGNYFNLQISTEQKNCRPAMRRLGVRIPPKAAVYFRTKWLMSNLPETEIHAKLRRVDMEFSEIQ